jgi:hypothetical protein
MALRWYATAPIFFANVRAFNAGEWVPDSIVAAHSLASTGPVAQVDVDVDDPAVVLRPLLVSDLDTDEERELILPSRLSVEAQRAASVAAVVEAIEDGDIEVGGGLSAEEIAADPVVKKAFVSTTGPSPTLRRDFPMRVPRVMASPPTIVAAPSSGGSAIAGSVLVSAFEAGAFTYLGGPASTVVSNPHPIGLKLGTYPFKTSPTPTFVEFWLDTADPTGRFEIYWVGPASQAGMRVAIEQADGSWGYITAGATFTHAATGGIDLITLGAPGTYGIRLEFPANSTFCGVYCGPTDQVSATALRPKRWIVMGDSITEPTFDESNPFIHSDGWVQRLAYLTGFDMWSAGSGGTGYLNTNAGGNRVKFRDRLAADVLAFKPDGILWAGGINDTAFSPDDVGAEAALCYQMAKDAGVPEQVVLSPFWSKELITSSPASIIRMADLFKAAALSRGLTFLNLLELPRTTDRLNGWAGSTVQAATTIGQNTIVVDSIPDYFKVGYTNKGGWYVRIGGGTTVEIRRVTAITGTGPWTLTLNANLGHAHAPGEPVVLSGGSYITGTGRQNVPTASGNGNRYVGAGGTHMTTPGNLHIARVVAGLWADALPG